mgnify:CR=1 FL=1
MKIQNKGEGENGRNLYEPGAFLAKNSTKEYWNEAENESVHYVERMTFVSIFESNLDEVFYGKSRVFERPDAYQQ